MSIDTTPLGQAAAKLMEEIESEYPEARIELAGVVIDLSYLDEDEVEHTVVEWRFAGPGDDLPSSAHSAGVSSIMAASLTMGHL